MRATLVPTPIFCPGLFAVFLSSYVPVLVAFAAFSLLCHIVVSCRGILALLLPFLMLILLLHLELSPLKIFKPFLSDKSWPYMSTSLTKLFCFFPALGAYNSDNYNSLYNLTNNNERKWDFNTVFINSRLLANNYN